MIESETWLRLANYDTMRYTESKLLIDIGNGNYVAWETRDNLEIGTAERGIIVTKNYAGPHFTFVAKASLLNFRGGNDLIESIDFDVLYAHAQADISKYYVGAEANLVLVEASASAFDIKVALGADTGIGIKDDSLVITAVGTGITLGRKIGISILGSEFSVDFGKFFN